MHEYIKAVEEMNEAWVRLEKSTKELHGMIKNLALKMVDDEIKNEAKRLTQNND